MSPCCSCPFIVNLTLIDVCSSGQWRCRTFCRGWGTSAVPSKNGSVTSHPAPSVHMQPSQSCESFFESQRTGAWGLKDWTIGTTTWAAGSHSSQGGPIAAGVDGAAFQINFIHLVHGVGLPSAAGLVSSDGVGFVSSCPSHAGKLTGLGDKKEHPKSGVEKWRDVRKKLNWRGGKGAGLVKTHYTHVENSQVIKKRITP